MAVVFIAGPLSGLIMQPLIGIMMHVFLFIKASLDATELFRCISR